MRDDHRPQDDHPTAQGGAGGLRFRSERASPNDAGLRRGFLRLVGSGLSEPAVRPAYKIEEARIITHDGMDVGWLARRDPLQEIILTEFYIAPEHQNRGTGTRVLRDLIA